MHSTITRLSIAAAVALGLAASGASAQTLRFAHVDPDDWQGSKKGAAAHVFKNIVEGETGLTVEIFPAGALGNEDELIAQAQEGLTQVVMVSGAMSKVCKAASVLDIPYTFPSAPVAWDVLDSPFGDELAQHCLEQSGLRTLAYGETGFRNFTNNVREIRTPADMAGPQVPGPADPALRRNGQGPRRRTDADRLDRAAERAVDRCRRRAGEPGRRDLQQQAP
jgi:TRAP-type transport system periplasmic protein